jgi:hypothetical protein
LAALLLFTCSRTLHSHPCDDAEDIAKKTSDRDCSVDTRLTDSHQMRIVSLRVS